MSQYLLAADVDQIQGYIFGSNRMRTIRGASALVAQFGETVKEKILNARPSGCAFLRHQGGEIILVANENPEGLLRIIQETAAEMSGSAMTITGAYEPYPDSKDFQKILSRVFSKIKHLKEQNLRGQFASLGSEPVAMVEGTLGGGFIRYCDLCKQAPATIGPDSDRYKPEFYWEPGNDKKEHRFLCLACWQRKNASNNHDLDTNLVRRIRQINNTGNAIGHENYPTRFPKEIEDIWPSGQEGRLVGLVMADGDGIGQLLGKIPTPELYMKFSSALDEICYQAVARAIHEIGYDAHRQVNILPIIYGGDDFTFFLPAEDALKFAQSLGDAFADLTGRDSNCAELENTKTILEVLNRSGDARKHLTLSFGVVAAKPSFPFLLMRKLGDELRKNAKRQRTEKKIAEGMVDFAMITSANSDDLRTMRAYYQLVDDAGAVSLTSWPYSISDLKTLDQLRQAINLELPRSQRKFLYAEFWKGRRSAESAYRSLIRKKGLKGMQRNLKKLGCLKVENSPFIGDSLEKTVLLDGLELSELVSE